MGKLTDFDRKLESIRSVRDEISPYFELELSGTKVETRTLKHAGLNPCWDPSDGWLLCDKGGQPYLFTRAYHKVTFGEDIPLGTCKIALEDLLTTQKTSIVVPLTTGNVKTGTLHFNVQESINKGTAAQKTTVASAAAGTAGVSSVAAIEAQRQKNVPVVEGVGKSADMDCSSGTGTRSIQLQRLEVGNSDSATEYAGGGVQGGGAAAAGAGAAGMTITEDEEHRHEDSFSRDENAFKTVKQIDTSDLETSEDHWLRTREATTQARQQAHIIEEAAVESQMVAESLIEANREAKLARQMGRETQGLLAALELTDKRAAAHQAKDQYDHEVGRALPLVSAGNEAAEKSVALNEIVALKYSNQVKDLIEGDVTEGQRQRTALEELLAQAEAHRGQLAQLAAALAAAEAATKMAEEQHRQHLAVLLPLRQQHDRSQEDQDKLERAMGEIRRYHSEVEAERTRQAGVLEEASQQLMLHRSQVAELEPHIQQLSQNAEEQQNMLAEVAAALRSAEPAAAEHSQVVEHMNTDTLALMEDAKRKKGAADAQHAALLQAQEAADAKERVLIAHKEALDAAQSQASGLETEVKQRETDFHEASRHAERLHRELLASKRHVELAQARKEELWKQAKEHGEMAKKASNAYYKRMADANRELLASMTA